MFQLDDQFLADIGLADLPDAEKKPFLQHIYDQLEYRVGIRLSEGMSEDQLEEFESIIDHKPEAVDAWVTQFAPGYEQDEVYQRMAQAAGDSFAPAELKAEFAATKWLEVNRPDYRDVVSSTLGDLKNEIVKNREAILSPGQ